MPGETLKPMIVGITGGSGSGKTTVARALIERLGTENVVYLPHDAYYKPLHEMPIICGEIVNFDHPDALQTPLLIEHLRALKRGEAVEVPIYDFRYHRRTDRTERVEPKPVILVDGILIFTDAEIRALCDIRLYVDTESDIRLMRRLKRDLDERGRSLDSVMFQYQESVRPMHLEFVEPSKRYADLIIPEGGYNLTAMDAIAEFIQNRLSASNRNQASSR